MKLYRLRKIMKLTLLVVISLVLVFIASGSLNSNTDTNGGLEVDPNKRLKPVKIGITSSEECCSGNDVYGPFTIPQDPISVDISTYELE